MRLSTKAIALLSAADRDSKILAVARANGKVTMAMKTAAERSEKALMEYISELEILVKEKTNA